MMTEPSTTNSNNSHNEFTTIPSADILRLILAHLTENGLHESVRVIQQESGVGMAGSCVAPQQYATQCGAGQWAAVLKGLATIDKDRARIDTSLTAAVHEMSILELAEAGEWQTAYAVFRLLQQDDDMAQSHSEIGTTAKGITISRSLEQKLADLAAERQKDPACTVAEDYYGKGSSRQERREEIGQRLEKAIPKQPANRLTTLLQQAIKWQSYTGQIPRIRKWWEEEEEEEEAKDDEHHQKKKPKRSKKRKEFDLVLGEVTVDGVTTVGDSNEPAAKAGKIISQDFATIKFGKNAVCESAVFLPDGSGLVTGSSDGLIEIHDNNGELRTDLVYQEKEELLGHDNGAAVTAVTVSNDTTLLASGATDGTVHVWRIDTGKCLRTFESSASASSISSLAFSPESSHVLVASQDGTCREFGLRTARMLKEFRGHSSYLTSCSYKLLPSSSSSGSDDTQLVVITASGDGSVRIWNGKTADVLHVLRPISMGLRSNLSRAGTSIVSVDMERTNNAAGGGSSAIHTVLKLHTPSNTMIIVPRGLRAFLVNYEGTVLRTFQDEGSSSTTGDKIFVAATVSASNRWLYAIKEDGVCCVFDVTTGKCEKSIRDFGEVSTSSAKPAAEVSTMLYHPQKDILAAFSNDKGQKKGRLLLWK